MMLSIVAVSIAAFLAVIIGTAAGLTAKDFAGGVWPTVFTLPLVGLPIGFLLIVALLITTGIRRSREARADAASNVQPKASKKKK